MNYLTDTCVISELIKPLPHPAVPRWVAGQEEIHLFLSVITLGEIQKGIQKLPPSKRQRELRLWLHNDLRERFDGRILPIDDRVAIQWGAMQAAAEAAGCIMPAIDSLIAATGLAHHMVVVTRNVQDMAASGAALFNPWEEAH